jgi:hypothetical protein
LRIVLAGLCAALACFPARAQESAGVTARPDQRVQLDFQHYYTVAELGDSLAALAAAYPEFMRLESLGQSAAGRELWVLSITRLADGEPGRKPGLLLVGGLGEQDLWGTEMALFTALELVKNHQRDRAAAAVLERAVVYVVPSAHPDLRSLRFDGDAGVSPGGDPVHASIDANFEIGWTPRGRDAGPYPLSVPESEALARFLLEHENIAAVELAAAAVERGVPAGLVLDPEDGVLHRRLTAHPLAGGALLVGLPDAALGGGSLLEFAHGHRGLFGFIAEVGGRDGGSPGVDELFGLGQRAFGATLELAGSLAELEIAPVRVERLGRELWQFDLAVHNRGVLPTQSNLGAARYAAGPPRIGVTGATLSAAALANPAGDGYDVIATRGQGFAIGELAGASARGLRVILRDAGGGAVTFEVRAPRAGTARLELVLE